MVDVGRRPQALLHPLDKIAKDTYIYTGSRPFAWRAYQWHPRWQAGSGIVLVNQDRERVGYGAWEPVCVWGGMLYGPFAKVCFVSSGAYLVQDDTADCIADCHTLFRPTCDIWGSNTTLLHSALVNVRYLRLKLG